MGRRTPAPRSGSFGGPAGVGDWVVMNPAIARTIATHLHLGQTDKLGEPYYRHVCAVGDMVVLLGGTDEEVIAAYLHDAVEDGKTTIEALREMGTPEVSLAIIDAVSKRKGEANEESLRRVLMAGRGACLVKFADLLHNTRGDRVASLLLLARGATDPVEAERKVYARLAVYRRWLVAVQIELGLLGPEVGVS